MQRRWKKKINEGVSGAAQNQASVIAHRGWKSSYRSLLPVEGEIFFLTFPFIDQAITLKALLARFVCARTAQGQRHEGLEGSGEGAQREGKKEAPKPEA
jgi:hypothetical protein